MTSRGLFHTMRYHDQKYFYLGYICNHMHRELPHRLSRQKQTYCIEFYVELTYFYNDITSDSSLDSKTIVFLMMQVYIYYPSLLKQYYW